MSFLLISYDSAASLKTNLRRVIREYERKFGNKPNTFFLHPSRIRRDVHIGSVNIVRRQTVMPNTIGVTVK